MTCGDADGMVFHMKITLNIDDGVMQQLREEAARRKTTISALVEAGLRRILTPAPPVGDSKAQETLPSWDLGPTRVDIANREELYRVMEGQ